MSKAWAGGSTRAWRRLRAQVLELNRLPVGLGGNDGRCRRALSGVCTGQADTVHHTLGRAVTGDEPAYLEAVCAACNFAIGEPAKHEPRHKAVTEW